MSVDCHFVWIVQGSCVFRSSQGRLDREHTTTRVCAGGLDEAVEMWKATIMAGNRVSAGTEHKFTVTSAHQTDNLVYYPAPDA